MTAPRRLAPALALGLLAALALPGARPALAQAAGGGATAAQVQALEEEMRRLRGRVEELEFRLQRIAEDAARRINDLEYRLTLAEGGDPSLVGDPVPLGETPGGGEGAGAVSVSERVALEEAVAALEAGEAARARERLLGFLAQYPDGPLTPEAEHWLGRAQWELGDTRAAAQTFLTNVTAYPDGAKAADSLLMLARALAELGRSAEACETLDELGRRFPDSAPAGQGDELGARIGCS
jgi:tol-pal system protein YbgF